MRQIRDILRLHWKQRLTMRQIAHSLGVSLASVSGRIHDPSRAVDVPSRLVLILGDL